MAWYPGYLPWHNLLDYKMFPPPSLVIVGHLGPNEQNPGDF